MTICRVRPLIRLVVRCRNSTLPVLSIHIAQGSRPEPSLLASSYLPSSRSTSGSNPVTAAPAECAAVR